MPKLVKYDTSGFDLDKLEEERKEYERKLIKRGTKEISKRIRISTLAKLSSQDSASEQPRPDRVPTRVKFQPVDLRSE
jgi:hypothetical protein